MANENNSFDEKAFVERNFFRFFQGASELSTATVNIIDSCGGALDSRSVSEMHDGQGKCGIYSGDDNVGALTFTSGIPHGRVFVDISNGSLETEVYFDNPERKPNPNIPKIGFRVYEYDENHNPVRVVIGSGEDINSINVTSYNSEAVSFASQIARETSITGEVDPGSLFLALTSPRNAITPSSEEVISMTDKAAVGKYFSSKNKSL